MFRMLIVFITLLFTLSVEAKDNYSNILLAPDSLTLEEYFNLSQKSFPGGGEDKHLESLQKHLNDFREIIPEKIKDGTGYTGSDLNSYEWLIALLEGAALEYSISKQEEKNLFSLEVKQRLSPNEITLDFNHVVPNSIALKIIQQEASQRWIEFNSNIPDTALAGILISLSNVSQERFSKNGLLQATLRYALELIISRGERFNRFPSIHTRSSEDPVSIYEKALLKQSSVAEGLEEMGHGWHQRSLQVLRQKSLKRAGSRILQTLESDQSPIKDGLNTFKILYPEYVSFVSTYKEGSSVIDDWLAANINHKVRKDNISEAVATLDTNQLFIQHELQKQEIPPRLFVSYVDNFIQYLSKDSGRKLELLHDGRTISYGQYEAVFSNPIIRPELDYGDSGSSSLSSTLLELMNYFYTEDDRIEALNERKSLHSGLQLLTFAEISQKDNWLTALEKLQAFAQKSRPKERQVLYSHLRWHPQYWLPTAWEKDGILSKGLQFYNQREFNYHKNQVAIIRYLTGVLNLPLDTGQNVTENPDKPSTSTAQSAYQLIQKQLTDRVDKDVGLGRIYEALFHSAFKGKYIVSEQESLAKANSLLAANVTQPEDDETTPDKFLKPVFFTGEGDEKAITLSTVTTLGLFESSPVDLPNPNVAAAFETLASRYDFVAAAATKSALKVKTLEAIQKLGVEKDKYLAELNRFLYSKPSYPDVLNALQQDLSIQWQGDFGGQALYEDSIRILIQLALAQSELQAALAKHRAAGFIFEPEIASASWLDKSKIIDSLVEARQHYVTSEALFRALVDQSNLALSSNFGAEDILRLSTLFPSGAAKNLKLTHPLPLESIGDGVTPIPILTQGVIRGLENTRNRLDRLDLAQDAYGYSGVLQMVAGVEELFQQLEFFAGTIEQSDIKSTVTAIKNSLNLQQRQFATESRHQQVYAKAFELGGVDLELVNAGLSVERAKLLSSAEESELFASHFNTEAARQMAESAHAEATAALLESNLSGYEAFVIDAQIQILMSALPAYTLELQKAETMLGKTQGMVGEYKEILADKRTEYLKNKSDRDVGSLLKAMSIQIVDAVSTAYGLPPLGSIVDTTFEGIQAASDGNYAAALSGLRKAASLSGADEKAKKIVGDILDNDSMEWAKEQYDDLKKSKAFEKIEEVAEASGLDDYAAAEGLAFLSNTGKGFLPDDMIDQLIPPEEFAWVEEEGNIKDNIKNVLAVASTKHGKTLVVQLGRSGLKESLELIDDDEKIKKFLKNRLKFDLDDKKKPGASKAIKEAAKNIRDDASSALKKVINQKISDDKQKFAIFKEQTEKYLTELVIKEGGDIEDPAFEKLINKLKEKDFEEKDAEGNEKDGWKEFLAGDLIQFARDKEYKKNVKEIFETTVNSKSLSELKDAGIVQTGKGFLSGLGDSIIAGQFDIMMKAEKNALTKDEMEMRLEELSEFHEETRDMLAGIKTSIDLSVAAHSAKFIPETKGAMINVLDSWESELNEMFKNSGDKALSEDIKAYYTNVKERFSQVNLYEELDPQQIEVLMDPPEVTLPANIQKQVQEIDQKLAEARQSVEKITGSQQGISDQLEKIYDINDEGNFNTQMEKLFEPFDEYLSELQEKISAARTSTGYASDALNDWLQNKDEDNPVFTSASKGFELHRLIGSLDVDEAELDNKQNMLKEQLEILENRFAEDLQKRKTKEQISSLELEIEKIESKIANDESKKETLEEELPELINAAIRSYVDEIANQTTGAFQLEETHKQLLLSTFDQEQFPPPEFADPKELAQATKVITQALLSVEGNDKASGLYKLAQSMKAENWKLEIKKMKDNFIQASASHKSLAASMLASAERSRKLAQERHFDVSKLNITIAEGAKNILETQRESLVHEIKATEYDFLAADTEYSLSKLDSWELAATGESQPILSPARLELVSRAVSRAFRDIAFISHFYEGKDIREIFNESLSSDKKFSAFNQQGIWKPSAILSMIDRIKVVRILEENRMQQAQIVSNGPSMLTLTKKDLLDYGTFKASTRLDEDQLLSLYVQLEPADGSECSTNRENPAPFWFQNENSIGFGNLVEPHRLINVCFRETANGNRSRYTGTYLLRPNGFIESDTNAMYIRHMGDGYITMRGEQSSKNIIPIHWKANPRINRNWDSINIQDAGGEDRQVSFGRLANHSLANDIARAVANNRCEDSKRCINFDYFASIKVPGDNAAVPYPEAIKKVDEEITRLYNKELTNRTAFHLYPLAGTYEILIDLQGEGIDTFSEDFEVKLLFTGSAIGAGS